MKTLQLLSASMIAAFSYSTHAAELPHAALVAKYLQAAQNPKELPGCAETIITAPRSPGVEANCWAASTASSLAKEPAQTRTFVLDSPSRSAALLRCKSGSYKQYLESSECRAAAQAESFVSLRLPSIKSSLQPVKFTK